MLYKKLGEKIGGIGYYDEFRPPRTSAAGHYTIPGRKCQEKFFRQNAQKMIPLNGGESLYNYSDWCIPEFLSVAENT